MLLLFPFLLQSQVMGEFEGDLQSSTLAGTGDRNVVADANGILKIGAAGTGLPASPVKGEMVYYDGTIWQSVPPGTNGQMLTMCNCVPTWGPCPTLTIGDNHAGGIIFYLDASGQSGLVAAPTDVTSSEWGCNGTNITGAMGATIGTGLQNTTEILAECLTPDIAADRCDDLVVNGFSDWYMPSIDELAEMYFNIGQGATGPNNNIGGFATSSSSYWSSTEGGAAAINARVINFGNGGGSNSVSNASKSDVRRVRPIRAF